MEQKGATEGEERGRIGTGVFREHIDCLGGATQSSGPRQPLLTNPSALEVAP